MRSLNNEKVSMDDYVDGLHAVSVLPHTAVSYTALKVLFGGFSSARM